MRSGVGRDGMPAVVVVAASAAIAGELVVEQGLDEVVDGCVMDA